VAAKPLTPAEMTKMAADAKAGGEGSQLTAALTPMMAMMINAPLGPFRDADFRTRAHLAGTQMLCALKRYQLAHGEPPAVLETAAAETELKTVPLDPYSGEPLKYALVEDKPTIYSIGKDLQDDGGQVDWKASTQPGDFLFVMGKPASVPEVAGPAAKAGSAQIKRSAKGGTGVATTKAKPKATAAEPTVTTPAASEPEVRTWTSTAGTTLEAELAGVDGTVAVLKKRDGAEVRVPLSKLSRFDQQWIKNNAP
jgi:hypothetical protein